MAKLAYPVNVNSISQSYGNTHGFKLFKLKVRDSGFPIRVRCRFKVSIT